MDGKKFPARANRPLSAFAAQVSGDTATFTA